MAASPLVLQLRRWLGRAGVSAAVDKRVDAGKTLALGPMTDGLAQAIRLHEQLHLPMVGRRKGATSWSDLGPAGVAPYKRPYPHRPQPATGLRFALEALDEIGWFFSRV